MPPGCKNVTNMFVTSLTQLRYGQEEIEAMLRSKGAKETVEVERKVSKEND